jgi:hypothetical protein
MFSTRDWKRLTIEVKSCGRLPLSPLWEKVDRREAPRRMRGVGWSEAVRNMALTAALGIRS